MSICLQYCTSAKKRITHRRARIPSYYKNVPWTLLKNCLRHLSTIWTEASQHFPLSLDTLDSCWTPRDLCFCSVSAQVGLVMDSCWTHVGDMLDWVSPNSSFRIVSMNIWINVGLVLDSSSPTWLRKFKKSSTRNRFTLESRPRHIGQGPTGVCTVFVSMIRFAMDSGWTHVGLKLD